MDIQSLIKNLHPLEIKVLLKYSRTDELTVDLLQKDLGYKEGHANQAFSWLAGKKIVEVVRRESKTLYEITDVGRLYAREGTPEQRIISYLKESGSHTLPEIALALNIENKDVGSAFGMLSKQGVLAMNAEKKVAWTGTSELGVVDLTAALLQKAVAAPDGLLEQA